MVHSRNRNTRRQEITDAARTCLDPCNMRDRWLWCAINCCQIFAIHAGLVRDKAITTSNHVPTVASTTVGEVEIYHIDMSPNPSSSMSRRRERDTFTPPPRFASCSQTSHLNETARTEIPEPEPEGQKGVPTSLTVTRMLGPGDLMMQGLCKSYAILSARGTGETQVDPRGSKGLLANVLATVPRGEAYEVVYPASGNVLADPESGAADVIRHARAMLEKCPTQKMVYFGYCKSASSSSTHRLLIPLRSARCDGHYQCPERSGLEDDFPKCEGHRVLRESILSVWPATGSRYRDEREWHRIVEEYPGTREYGAG